MKKAKKIIALLLCGILLVGASVAGTLAYLTDSKSVDNTFTVGNVHIKLDEANVDPKTGKETEGRTEAGNTEVLMVPGRTIDKDPTVTVLQNSEDCYVRLKVTVDVSESWIKDTDAIAAKLIGQGETFTNWANSFAANYLATGQTCGFNTNYWTVSEAEVDNDAKTITYMVTYKTGTDNVVAKNTTSNRTLEAIFDKVTVPTGLTNDQLALLAGMNIKVEAHAIQAEGFVKADGKTAEQNAWAAFDKQNP